MSKVEEERDVIEDGFDKSKKEKVVTSSLHKPYFRIRARVPRRRRACLALDLPFSSSLSLSLFPLPVAK